MMRTPLFWLSLALVACAAAPDSPTDTHGTDSAPDAVLATCLRAIARSPYDQELLNELVLAAEENDRVAQALVALQTRSDALGIWYQGRLHFAAACRSLEPDRNASALAELDLASGCFAAAMSQQPAYRDSCEQWLAMCLGKKGNVAFRAGNLANAERWLLDAASQRPDCLQVALGQGDSIKIGMLRLGDRYMRDFAKTEQFFRAAVAAAGPDIDLLNNAAIYARDTGTRLLRGGQRDAAMLMYERSYETYLRAVEIDPTSVRLRNDCALVAIHHLERDWARSRTMLVGAIADGEQRLAGLAPDSTEHRELDESIGDCYENLALWYLANDADPAAAAAAARSSLQHLPGPERASAKRYLTTALQRLDQQR